MKKILVMAVILLFGLSALTQTLIPDENYKSKINEKLEQSPDYEPTAEDLLGLTGELDAFGSSIQSIEGSQYMTNLDTLKLNYN